LLGEQVNTERLQQSEIQTKIDAAQPEGATQKDVALTNDIGNALNDGAFNSTFGLGGLTFRNIPGTPQFNLKKQVEKIKGQLALAARGEMKGQGAVSDFEGRLLSDAQTTLDLNLSPADARQEFINIRGAITTSSGGNAKVVVTDPNTGESETILSNQAGITQAIQDGLIVNYTE
jgi:hypothetical protein